MPFNLGFRHTADKLTETKELADQLCANRAEESRTYMYCVVCLYRCVSLPYTVFAALFIAHRSHCSLSKLCLDVWLPVAAEHKHNVHCERFPCLCITSLVSVPCCICYVNHCQKALVNMLQGYATLPTLADSEQPAACKDAGPPVPKGCRYEPVVRRFSTAT